MMLVKKFLADFEANELEKKMCGELIVLPLLNLTGFERGKRRTAPDAADLNRAFPGKRSGPFSQQFAYELFEKYVSHADVAIDCHDAGLTNILLPHTRVSDETLKLGRLFGAPVIVKRKGKEGMMALEAFNKYKIPLVTIEIGGAKHVANQFLDQGVEGIKNILKAYGILPGLPALPMHQYVLKSRYGIRADKPGVVEFTAKLGASVHAGEVLGSVYYPQSYKTEPLVSPMCGLLFALHDQQLFKKNEILFSVLEFKKCHVSRTTLNKFEELPTLPVEEIVM